MKDPEISRRVVRQEGDAECEEAGGVAGDVVAPVVTAVGEEEPGDGEEDPDEEIASLDIVVVADRRAEDLLIPSAPITRRRVRYETITRSPGGSISSHIGDSIVRAGTAIGGGGSGSAPFQGGGELLLTIGREPRGRKWRRCSGLQTFQECRES